MIQHDFFELLYSYMKERSSDNIQAQLKKDSTYQYAIEKETEAYQKYEDLNLPEEQDKIIEEYIDLIHDTNWAYSQVLFRIGMQCCFSLLLKLADLK